MTQAVPRPTGAPSPAALYQRMQERREGYFGPNYVSDLTADGTGIPRTYAESALRTVLGNAHIFESDMEVLTPVMTRYVVSGDAREFVREVANSTPFRKRFFDPLCNSRFVELCFKLLLARAPADQMEVAAANATLNEEGYNAFVDAMVDCGEYAERFGNVLVPCMAATGRYEGGMPGFCAQMRLQVPTRGANSDVTCSRPQTVGVLGGGRAAGCYELKEGYDVSVARYVPEFEWMKLPRSTLLRDWAPSAVVLKNVAENWSGLGTPRATGEANGPWEIGWKTVPSGVEWTAGWTGPPIYKNYV